MTRVVLHIGAPKTGTSFVQSVLSNNRDLLTERGVLWPGQAWSDQVRAVEDLRDATREDADAAPRWDAIVHQIDEFDGSAAVFSMEWLCLGDQRMAERAISTLTRHDVHVVLTLRDLARAIPAQWQESTQNGFGWTYADFVDGLVADRPYRNRFGGHFWNNQDWGRMVKTWAPLVPNDHLWVVTVPPAGSPTELLWHRFCEACGVDASGYVLQGWPNESLGAASAEVMRRLQAARRDEGPNPRHRAKLKHRLAKQTLAGHRKQEPTLIMPPQHYDWAVRKTESLVHEVRAAAPRLVGSWNDLMPTEPVLSERTVTDPASIDDAVLLDAALFGLLGLTRPRR